MNRNLFCQAADMVNFNDLLHIGSSWTTTGDEGEGDSESDDDEGKEDSKVADFNDVEQQRPLQKSMKSPPPPKRALPFSPRASPAASNVADNAAPRALAAWTVKMPPVKKHIVGGRLVPTVKGAFGFAQLSMRTRKLALEIRGPPTLPTLATTDNSNNNSVLQPAQKTEILQRLLAGDPFTPENREQDLLSPHDVIALRVLRLRKGGPEEPDSDDDDTVGGGGLDAGLDNYEAYRSAQDHANHTHWETHAVYRLEDLTLLRNLRNHTIELRLGAGNETVVRDVKFVEPKNNDPDDFAHILATCQSLEKARARIQMERYKQEASTKNLRGSNSKSAAKSSNSSSKTQNDVPDHIDLLVEIVSATDLPIADITSSDPYFIARMGASGEIHRTEVLEKTLHPVFTLQSGSLFLISMTPEEFFAATAGLTLVVKDFDAIGSNEILGQVNVPLPALLQATGERTAYDLIVPASTKKSSRNLGRTKASKVYLRIKPATPSDIEFMQVYQANQKKLGVYTEETYLPPRPPDSKLMQRMSKKMRGETHHRVKPFPDPSRAEEVTKWMTDAQIDRAAHVPSTNWMEAGSGDLGKVYLEILQCDGLPNMDKMTMNVRDKTDAFACVAFEDCLVNTDVIADSLSPRWMPWCRRAFCFNIDHPASDIFLAILDYDNPMAVGQLVSRATSDVHDPIARCLINLSKFLPDTVYTMKFPLYYGEVKEHRETTRGTITVRLRLEWNDMRKMLIKGLQPSVENYVSCSNVVDYQVAKYTTEGMHDYRAFSMNTFTSHIQELQSYEAIIPYLRSAMMTVWLWRGHYPVTVAGKTLHLPIHSMTAFSWGILVTWDFNLFPSFFLFSIGWMFLACGEHVRQHPSPWHRTRGFFTILKALAFGKSSTHTILANQDVDTVKAYEEEQAAIVARRLKQRELEEQHAKEAQERFGDDIENAQNADVDITSSSGFGVNLNPLKPILHPIQLILGDIIVYLRISKSVVLWEESYFTFWVVLASFAGSLALCWIPWGFLLRWILRIAVFVVLGPWMAIVDRVYISKMEDPNLTEEEKAEVLRKRLKEQYSSVVVAASHSQIRKERALKLKAMKKYMFGKYLLRVPRFMEDEFVDVPLPESHAEPYDTSLPSIVPKERKYGQALKGDMIPVREIQAEKLLPKEVPVEKRPFWRRRHRGTTVSPAKEAVASNLETVPLLSKAGKQYDATK